MQRLFAAIKLKHKNSSGISEISVEIFDNTTLPPINTTLNKLVKLFEKILLCCTFTVEKEALLFEETNAKYFTCFRLFHAKQFVTTLLCIRSIFFLFIAILMLIMQSSSLMKIVSIAAFGLTVCSCLLVFVAIQQLDTRLLLPFFIVTFVFGVAIFVYFFIDFLDSANTRNTTEQWKITEFIIQICLIAFEMYTMQSGWALFLYISDRATFEECKRKQKVSSTTNGTINNNKGDLKQSNDKADQTPLMETSSDDEILPTALEKRRLMRAKWRLSAAFNDTLIVDQWEFNSTKLLIV